MLYFRTVLTRWCVLYQQKSSLFLSHEEITGYQISFGLVVWHFNNVFFSIQQKQVVPNSIFPKREKKFEQQKILCARWIFVVLSFIYINCLFPCPPGIFFWVDLMSSGVTTHRSHTSPYLWWEQLEHTICELAFERSIFKTFWKDDCCTKSLYLIWVRNLKFWLLAYL